MVPHSAFVVVEVFLLYLLILCQTRARGEGSGVANANKALVSCGRLANTKRQQPRTQFSFRLDVDIKILTFNLNVNAGFIKLSSVSSQLSIRRGVGGGASSPVLEYKTICSEHKRAVRSGLLFTILSNLHNIIAKEDFMRDLKRTRLLGHRCLRCFRCDET